MQDIIYAASRRLLRAHIFKDVPHGTDFFFDIRRSLPNLKIEIIFDVGAHRGESALRFAQHYPGAKIYCFEPVRSTFTALQRHFLNNNNVICHQLGFSKTSGSGTFLLSQNSDMNRLVSAPPSLDPSAQTETVPLETLDDFCVRSQIHHINLLKIDTEGHDLDVLVGSDGLLQRHAIDLIRVEASMNSNNTYHCCMELIKAHLESKQYFLFGIYQQVPEWPTGSPNLRRADLVFISQPVIEKNRKA
jgi:FkbM family methyltransferase